MFKWPFKQKSLSDAIQVKKDSEERLFDGIFLVGDYVCQETCGTDPITGCYLDHLKIFHYSEAVKFWSGFSQKIIDAVAESRHAKWNFETLSRHNDYRVRALVAANGYYLSRLLNDFDSDVVNAVLITLVKDWRPGKTVITITHLYNHILSLKKGSLKEYKKDPFFKSCPCCNRKYES